MENKEKTLGGVQDQVLIIELLDSYFQGVSTCDSVRAFKVDDIVFIARIERFVPTLDKVKRWSDYTGLI